MKGQAKVGLLVFIGLIVLVAGYGIFTYNHIVRLHEQVPAAWSQVHNVLQRRNDLIRNLVETVKGYAKHEQTIFGDIAEATKSLNRAQTIHDKTAANDRVSSLLSRIRVLLVQSPTLTDDCIFS